MVEKGKGLVFSASSSVEEDKGVATGVSEERGEDDQVETERGESGTKSSNLEELEASSFPGIGKGLELLRSRSSRDFCEAFILLGHFSSSES